MLCSIELCGVTHYVRSVCVGNASAAGLSAAAGMTADGYARDSESSVYPEPAPSFSDAVPYRPFVAAPSAAPAKAPVLAPVSGPPRPSAYPISLPPLSSVISGKRNPVSDWCLL